MRFMMSTTIWPSVFVPANDLPGIGAQKRIVFNPLVSGRTR